MRSWPCFKCLLPECVHECVFTFKCATRGVIWCPSEDHNCQSSCVVRALLLESIWVPKALNCSVFRVWNNVVCMQRQVQFIMRNENILKIKETFFFVFTVHCVSLTPTLNLHSSFYKLAFCLFLHACRLNPCLPTFFFFFCMPGKWRIWEQMCISFTSREWVVGKLSNSIITFAEIWVFLTS